MNSHSLPRLVAPLAFAGAVALFACSMPAAQAPVVGAQVAPADPGVPNKVRRALLASDWNVAAAELEKLEREKPELADWWSYLRATVLARSGKLDAAVALFEAVEAREPASVWRAKARFARAEALRELGRIADAERIWEAEAGRLLSEKRQEELAAIYVGFADELARAQAGPGDVEAKREQLARACVLYVRVLALDVGDATRERARYALVVAKQAQEQWNEAFVAARDYREEFDPTRKSAKATGARVFDVRLRQADSSLRTGDRPAARRLFEDLCAAIRAARAGEAPWTEWRAKASDEQLVELTRIEGDAQHALARAYPDGADSAPLMAAALRQFVAAYPDHPEAPQAAHDIGARYQSADRDQDALAAFEAFLAMPPPATSDPARLEAFERLRMSALYRKGFCLRRRSEFDAAIAVFNDYVARYPTGPDWTAAQRAIVDCEYAIGDALRGKDEYEQAAESWRLFLQRHPLDSRAERIALDLAELHVARARALRSEALEAKREPDLARIEEEFRAAIAQWRRVANQYKDSATGSQAMLRIGQTAEDELGDLELAVAAYRACDVGIAKEQAAASLTRMTTPKLGLATERVFRTNETPRVRVDVRNLEALEVDVFALDLEAYFRKNLTHAGVEDLDLDLIAPERELSVKVEKYAQYKPIRQDIELPVKGPGVWAVAVTSGEWRATTLVIASDLDLVVRASRREALVFVEDMRQLAAVAGARVLLAGNGRSDLPEIVELTTEADGTAQRELDKLGDRSPLRVLVMHEGHVATNEVVRIAGSSNSLTSRGLAYTDRPVYRPGETVRWRAILREAQGGRLTFDPAAKARAQITDSKGNVQWSGELALSRFGTIHGELALDPGAQVGTYQISCELPQCRPVAAKFQVEQFQPPRIELVLEPAREVVFRGEKAQVTARASYYWGEPVAGAPLRANLPDGRELDLVTGADGSAVLEVDTREFASEQLLTFAALLTEEQVSASTNVFVALREFSAEISTRERVYLAGSSFDVKLVVEGADGEPLARAMSVEVLSEASNGGETRIRTLQLATNAQGEAHTALSLADGGEYVLRARAGDRFGNPIETQCRVTISGADDSMALRILADSHELQVGERAKLTLVNRGDAALALVTIESDRIIEHRIVRLTEGANALELAVDHVHFPNFNVSAAVMRSSGLSSDTGEFTVTRELVVKLTPERANYTPGERVAVLLSAVDQLGRPVEAELSLAVFDEALLALFADKTPPIRGVFEAELQRRGAFSTSSSCAFRYDGKTWRIAEALIAEQERARERAQWEEERAQTLQTLGEIASVAGDGPASPGALATGSDDFFLGRGEEEKPSGYATRRVGGGGVGQGGGGGRGGAKGRAGGPSASKPEYKPIADAPPEFAFWSPSIVTDAKGEARVEFTLPAVTARWHLVSRGVDAGELAGEANASLVSKDEFFVELRAPLALVEGDAPRCMARVHNATGMRGTAKLVLRAANGAESQSYPIDVALAGDAPVEVTFPALNPAFSGVLQLELEAIAELDGQAREGSRAASISTRPYRPGARTSATLVVRPWGREFASSRSGLLENSASFALELDSARKYGARSLELTIGPSVDSLLVGAAFGDGVAHWRGELDNTAAAASQLIGVCATLDLIARSGRTSAPEYERLRQRAQTLAGRVIGAQLDGGGWAWVAGQPAPHVPSSCTAMIAIAHASLHGATIDAKKIDRGTAYLLGALRDASQQDDETKAFLLWALAEHQLADFGALNRLHRERAAMSPAALAYTALALARMDNRPMAREAAETLENKLQDVPEAGAKPQARCIVDENGAWSRSQLEMTALATLALERAHPESTRIAPGVEFLLARAPWREARARGMAVAALATFRQAVEPATQRVRVVATLVGEKRTIELSPDSPGETVSIEVPATAPAAIAVELTLEGRGRPHFAATLRGFSSDFAGAPGDLRVDEHVYLAVAPRVRGKTLDTGFNSLVDQRDTWRNEVGALEFAQMTRARVTGSVRAAGGDGDYVVVEVALPAGTRLLDGSVEGSFVRHFEQRGPTLFVHLGQLWGADERAANNAWRRWQFEYTLIGAMPGAYRALPVAARSVYEPEKLALGEAKPFTVLARGETSSDKYRATPDELLSRGLAAFEAGELESARELLQRLIDEFEPRLREDKLADAARALLFANLERKSARDVVRYFEVLKEKDPALTIPFESVLAVGAAYREIDEHERALSIFRATIEETFGKELAIVAALEAQNELDAAFDTLARLIGEYPDAATIVDAKLKLADMLILRAPAASTTPSLSDNGRTRASMTFDAILELQRFLAVHTRDPRAPDAGLALITAHLGLADFVAATELGDELATAYTEPRFADAFRYSRAVAEWYLGRDADAAKLLEAIAEANYAKDNGGDEPSVNRELALFILAQIHHARQEYEKAAGYYVRVESEFEDARHTLAGFREKHISLPEVTEVKPGAPVKLELTHKNLTRAELLVYPVDLMTLYLREKNLSQITGVNLSGITPKISQRISLDWKAGMRHAKSQVALDLKDPGAYLVICRGDELHASGLVLISGLELEVSEDVGAGTLRVQVLDRETQRFVRDVDVRVIGTGNEDFASGTTDPRGLFTAFGLAGHATVIARSGDRQYAFHRGRRELAPVANARPPKLAPGGETYLKNVLEFNDQSQEMRDVQWQTELRRDRKGVQIQQVK